jgi:hypothetical protein
MNTVPHAETSIALSRTKQPAALVGLEHIYHLQSISLPNHLHLAFHVTLTSIPSK